jgi:YRPW motif-containing protein
MVAIEGMDLQDPLRLRLMSHLQCYSAQRELALKSSATHTGWNPSAFTTPTYPALPSTHTSNMSSLTSLSSDSMPLHGTVAVSSHYTPNGSHHFHHQSIVDASNSTQISGQQMMNQSVANKSSGSPAPISSSMPIGYPPSSTSSMSAMTTNGQNVHNPYFSSGYMTGASFSTSGVMSQQQNSSVKHYRPWGAELVY